MCACPQNMGPFGMDSLFSHSSLHSQVKAHILHCQPSNLTPYLGIVRSSVCKGCAALLGNFACMSLRVTHAHNT